MQLAGKPAPIPCHLFLPYLLPAPLGAMASSLDLQKNVHASAIRFHLVHVHPNQVPGHCGVCLSQRARGHRQRQIRWVSTRELCGRSAQNTTAYIHLPEHLCWRQHHESWPLPLPLNPGRVWSCSRAEPLSCFWSLSRPLSPKDPACASGSRSSGRRL